MTHATFRRTLFALSLALFVLGSVPTQEAQAQPANDDLADAVEITAMPFSATGSNVGATNETDEDGGDSSVWWKYTPAQKGLLTVDTFGSNFDTVLSVWTGSGHPLTRQALNNDAGGSEQSELFLTVEAGTTYYIRVSGSYSGVVEGDISLSATLGPPLPNDDLADAVEITSLPFAGTGSNVGAAGEANEADASCGSSNGAANSVWWTYTASQDGVLTVDTDGSDFDRVLSLWTGGSHPLSEAQCTDESPEKVSTSVAAGQTYHIRVSGYSNSGEGAISLSASFAPPLPNDDLADATEIASTPYSTTATLVGATLEPDETITDCGDESGGEGSVWWTYAASQAGKLTIDTDGSDFDLVMSVWTGDGHPLTSRGCTDSDSGGVLEVSAGETYYVRISNYYPDEVGDISLEATFALPDPVYVDGDATGANDGTSWADAYTDLHDALADGAPELWVAEGTYSTGGAAFDLTDGVRLYGGFAGTETTRSERDWRQHETILNGSSDHVLYAREVGGSTVLDGFTVSGGDADGGGDEDNGGGFFCDGRNYGFGSGCSPTIRNVIFENNAADGEGGALYLAADDGRTSPQLYNVTFRDNSASDGGAIYVDAESGLAYPVLQNVVFADNSAGRGGAVHIWAGLQGTASPSFTNALFVGNTALSGGGAVYTSQAGGTGGTATPSFTNATFAGNNADQGDVIWNYKIGDGNGEVSLFNVVVWDNNDDGMNGIISNQSGATTSIVDAIVEGSSNVCFLNEVQCTRVVDEDPDFRSASNPDGVDGTFRTDDDGLRLGLFSPAIDAGDYVANATASDVTGGPRVFGATIDLGAYERAVYESESDAPGVGAQGGFFKLGSTGATVLFSANASSNGGLSASRTDSAPSGPGLPAEVVPSYWTITESLDGSFTYNVTLDLAGASGINEFDSLRVYKRSGPGDTWATVDSLIHNEAAQTVTAAGLTSFSEFAVGGTSTALPVELAAFEATPDGADAVALTWQTASETNNDRFRIERQREGDAGWAKLGVQKTQAPGGTSAEAISYRFEDTSLPFEASALTYRLIQRDLDGTETVAGEQTVEIGAPRAFTLHGNYPNPVRSQTTIRYELPEKRRVTLAVYDALGRKVRTLVDEAQTGRQEVAFETTGLASGVYFYRITAGDYTQARKLVLVR